VPFKVLVDDNYHYMDESERYTLGVFATADEALAAARGIVDECLAAAYKPGMTPTQLHASYTMFGEDPFIVPVPPEEAAVAFSAWAYARERCERLCAPAPPREDSGGPA
jgi:hypothetical protein